MSKVKVYGLPNVIYYTISPAWLPVNAPLEEAEHPWPLAHKGDWGRGGYSWRFHHDCFGPEEEPYGYASWRDCFERASAHARTCTGLKED